MSTLRRIAVRYLGPDAITPANTPVVELGVRLAEGWSTGLRGLGLTADRANLVIVVREKRTDDDAVHWRFLDGAGLEYEAAQIMLPDGAGAWSAAQVEQVLVGAARAVLQLMAALRGWDAGVVDRIVPPVDGDGRIPLVYDPPPPMWIFGGGPMNDPRTHLHADRYNEHVQRFNDDPEWWAWWLATGRPEADLTVLYEGWAGLRVTVTDRRITFGRVRPAATIPRDPSAAAHLADEDMAEALARLVTRLALPPHPPLR